MFEGLAFAVKARKFWKRLRRLIKQTQGVPVDVVIASYLLRREKKSIALCVTKVVERNGAALTGATPDEKAAQAQAILLTGFGRYFQHKL